MSDADTKGPGGRPTKYDPAFCDRVIELGRLGKSRAWIASELNVSRDTLEEWERIHPEFSDAMDEAMLCSQRWWEDAGQDGLTAGPGSFNAAVWSRSMAARFPSEWREKRVRVDIPEVKDNASIIEAQARVSAAIASGKLDTDGGTILSKLLTDLGTSMERLEIESGCWCSKRSSGSGPNGFPARTTRRSG